MAPTDLVSSPPTQFVMNNTTNNNLSFSADMSGPNPFSAGVFPQTATVSSSDSNIFGVIQLTPVGANDANIRTLVPVNISILLYRKALIAKLFFRQILGYADSPSISVSDLISTVASYFDMSTAMAEREAESASISILCPVLASLILGGSQSLSPILITAHVTFLILLFARLLTLTLLMTAHCMPCLNSNFRCVCLTILYLLPLIFRCRALP